MNLTEQEITQRFPFFEKGLIAEIVHVAELKTFNQGTVMMRTGQYIRSTMIIMDGLVKIYREYEEGNEFFMYYLDAGKACALSMVCASKQETSELMAKAITETTVLSIPLLYMDQWMVQYKSWYQFVLGSYRERFEELLQTIDHIAFRNMDERLVFYLKRHQDMHKSNIVTIPFTEIAQELNSSREVISRLMRKLADKGFIKLHRSYVEIVSLDRVLV
jgi:CRP/FNR family transcriptional regulator, anaerobic regulatory protein